MRVSPLTSILFFLLISGSLNLQAKVWSVSTAHEQNFISLSRNSQVVDDTGNPHVFYGGSHLYHSYRNADGSWSKEVIDNSPQVGKYTVAKRDGNGNYHILYTDPFENFSGASTHSPVVKYAISNATGWTIEVTPIPATTFGRTVFGGDHSIDIDSSGNVHFAYMSGGNGLYHATRDNTGWQIEELNVFPQGLGSDPGDIMLAIGPDNTVHIGYYVPGTMVLEHASNSGGIWSFEVVNPAITSSLARKWMALAIDSKNTTYICYPLLYLSVGVQLVCSSNASGSWTHEVVDDGTIDALTRVGAGYFPSLYIDNADNLHLTYLLDQYVRYAHKNNGVWGFSTYNIPPKTDYLRQSNLTILGDGSIGLFAVDSDPDSISVYAPNVPLYFIKWDGVSWTQSTIDVGNGSSFAAGFKSDIVVDQSGFSHVIYVVEDNISASATSLYYSTNLTGSWVAEKLSNFPRYFYHIKPALTLDANGFAHIAYANQDIGTVGGTYYLTNSSGVWTQELVESEFMAVGNYSIAVDSVGNVYFAYISNGSLGMMRPWEVRYATNSSGAWVSSSVYQYNDNDPFLYDRNSFPDSSTSLALDSTSNAHIAFVRDERLMQATQVQSGWMVQTILTSDDVPSYGFGSTKHWDSRTITYDKNLDIHFGYEYRQCVTYCLPVGIVYSKYSSGQWQHQLVDPMIHPANFLPSQPTIEVDNTGRAYLAYYNNAYEHMRLVELANGCLTQSVEVDNSLSMWTTSDGSYSLREYSLDSSLAIDADGNVRIAYFDKPNMSLKYAVSSPGLEIGACNVGTADVQPINLNINNLSGNPVVISDLTLIGKAGGSIASDACSADLINPSSSCSILVHAVDSLATTISGVLYATVTDAITNKKNAVFFNVPEVTTSTGNPDSNSSGGGGFISLYLLYILSVLVVGKCVVSMGKQRLR